MLSFSTSSAQNCSDNAYIAQAVRAAFQASAISRVQCYVQNYYDTNFPDPTEEFDYTRFTGISFSAGAGNIGIGGRWEYVTRTRALVANFYGDDRITTMMWASETKLFTIFP
ncbi:hypothetical protein ACOJR9_05555 [Alteromonas sp. A081]|uniref:hypothetical protein n=1 Tax=Alteromonas sp. A081 TaxID=3410269 RepID=UPI003B98601B